MTGNIPKIRFYTKDECHLCEKAFKVVKQVSEKTALDIEIIDIATDDELMGLYGTEIPVIEINGKTKFRYKITEDELTRALKSLT